MQFDIGSLAGVQCVIFGIFGINSEFDGSVRTEPTHHSFAYQLSFKGVKLYTQVFWVVMNQGIYKVACQGKTLKAKFGQVVTINIKESLRLIKIINSGK